MYVPLMYIQIKKSHKKSLMYIQKILSVKMYIKNMKFKKQKVTRIIAIEKNKYQYEILKEYSLVNSA